MPPISYHEWCTTGFAALDKIENAHRTVGGTGPGRRYATQHNNQVYTIWLASHFQGFCRDLHSECVNHLVAPLAPAYQTMLRDLLTEDRRLDKGNAQPSGI